GQDLTELARQLERAREQLAGALETVQVRDIAQAVQQAEDTRTLRTDISSNERMLALHAPQGIVALQQELALLNEQIQQADAAMQAQPPVTASTESLSPEQA